MWGDRVMIEGFAQSFGNAVAAQLTHSTGLYWVAVGETYLHDWGVTFSSPSLPFQIAIGEWECDIGTCGYTAYTTDASHVKYHIEESTRCVLESAKAKCFDVSFDSICNLWRKWNVFR